MHEGEQGTSVGLHSPSARVKAPDKKVLHSIVVAVLNEAPILSTFRDRLVKTLENASTDFEILFVDDGSTDATWSILQEFAEQDPRIRAISLSRNFGHQLALLAGLDHARGDAVITMDGDLQHPPELVPLLIDQFRLGYDVVYTIRVSNETEKRSNQMLSRFFTTSSGV